MPEILLNPKLHVFKEYALVPADGRPKLSISARSSQLLFGMLELLRYYHVPVGVVVGLLMATRPAGTLHLTTMVGQAPSCIRKVK